MRFSPRSAMCAFLRMPALLVTGHRGSKERHPLQSSKGERTMAGIEQASMETKRNAGEVWTLISSTSSAAVFTTSRSNFSDISHRVLFQTLACTSWVETTGLRKYIVASERLAFARVAAAGRAFRG